MGRSARPGELPDGLTPESFAVFAGVLPEDKYHLVQAFREERPHSGDVRDGANDAPALRQAQMGIAVSTATDVAKSAAGIVLTEAGLSGIVASVKEGRTIFQRILTYILKSVTHKFVGALFLLAGILMTGHAVLTPLLLVISMITGDFPVHARHDGQCPRVSDTQCLASGSHNGSRSRPRLLRPSFLHRSAGRGEISSRSGHRRFADSIHRDADLQRPSDPLRRAGAPAPLELAAEPLAHGRLHGRPAHYRDPGHARDTDDASAVHRGGHTTRATASSAFCWT